jgi:phage/plasmid-like protein (TIGR03299 family)
MPHELFQNTMAYVGDEAWHGLGQRVPANVSAAAMVKAANLDWQVRKQPAPGARRIAGDPPIYDRYLVIRDRVGGEIDDVALALVGKSYEPLQNSEAFAFFAPFIDNKWAEFHTAGALRRGERVWVLARLVGDIVIGGDDTIERFLLLANSHDGSGAITVRFTPIRVVCQNTLNLAVRGGSGVISVRHTKHVAKHLADAQAEQMKRVIDKVFTGAEHLFGRMALHQMGAKETDRFLELLFPRTERQIKASTEPERWKRIKGILEDDRLTSPKTRGTLWALYNAVVRDEDYRRSRNEAADGRLDRIWFGSGNDLKLKALHAARQQMRVSA